MMRSLLTRGAPCCTRHTLARTQPDPIPTSSQFCVGSSHPGREAAQGPPLWDLLRHLHSDSETHFYLFTVNSGTWQLAVSGRLRQWCLLLASPLEFQDKLPRNCLRLPPVPSKPPALPSVCTPFGLLSGTEQVQDPGFCCSPGRHTLLEVKALKFSSVASDRKLDGVNERVVL